MTKVRDLVFRQEITPDDSQAVRRLVESTGFFYPAETAVAVELVDERLAKGDASGYFFVFAEADERTVGYACYGPIACTVGSYDMYWLAVERQHQGQGFGRRVLEETEACIAKKAGRHIYIETSNRPQYEPTRRFYLRHGYEVIAVLKDFYDRGDDKVILRKQLGS